jgi:hypothetical protein
MTMTMLTSKKIMAGLVIISQAMLARFFSPPDRPRTHMSPITETTAHTNRASSAILTTATTQIHYAVQSNLQTTATK